MQTANRFKLLTGDAKEAFETAIAMRVLSDNIADDNFAGNYMYMYTKNGQHYFKHIVTREYVAA